jgi:hypothetical protein
VVFVSIFMSWSRAKKMKDWISKKLVQEEGLLGKEYPVIKCPKCGGAEYELCLTWLPNEGLDQSMRLLRCATIKLKFTEKLDINGFKECHAEKCTEEYYIAPCVTGHGKREGTVL